MNESCEWTRSHLQAHLDGELPADERVRVERHLQTCARCHESFALGRRGDRLVRDAATMMGDTEEREARARMAALQERFDLAAAERLRRREMLTDAGGEPMSAEDVAAAPLEDELRRAARPRRRGLFAPRPVWRWVSIGSAAAAVAVVAVVLLVREPDLPQRGMHPAAAVDSKLHAPAPTGSRAPVPTESRGTAQAGHAAEKKAGTPGAEAGHVVTLETAKREKRVQALEPPTAVVGKERSAPAADKEALGLADAVETEEATVVAHIETPARGPMTSVDLTMKQEASDDGVLTSSMRDDASWGNVTRFYRGDEPLSAIQVQAAPAEQETWTTILSFLQEPGFDLSGASNAERGAMLDLAEEKLRSEDAPDDPGVSPGAVWVAVGDAWFAIWERERDTQRHLAAARQASEPAPSAGQRAYAAYLEAVTADADEPIAPEQRRRVQRQIELLEAYRVDED